MRTWAMLARRGEAAFRRVALRCRWVAFGILQQPGSTQQAHQVVCASALRLLRDAMGDGQHHELTDRRLSTRKLVVVRQLKRGARCRCARCLCPANCFALVRQGLQLDPSARRATAQLFRKHRRQAGRCRPAGGLVVGRVCLCAGALAVDHAVSQLRCAGQWATRRWLCHWVRLSSFKAMPFWCSEPALALV